MIRDDDRFSQAAPFMVAWRFIAHDEDRGTPGAFALRLVSPDPNEAHGGTDLQGRFENRDGKSYWLTLLTFRETLGNVHHQRFRDPHVTVGGMPPFPFGYHGTADAW